MLCLDESAITELRTREVFKRNDLGEVSMFHAILLCWVCGRIDVALKYIDRSMGTASATGKSVFQALLLLINSETGEDLQVLDAVKSDCESNPFNYWVLSTFYSYSTLGCFFSHASLQKHVTTSICFGRYRISSHEIHVNLGLLDS
jgi:hypothetical protein